MRQALLVVLTVLALRLPYLSHPIQGDDIYYLAGAQHALIDPLHPNHAQYAFQGEMVSMQGHPHPPFNAWFLGGVLALVGDIKEVPFHAAYVFFSLVAALSALSLARRFTDHPLTATLLFLATPAFVINGNSLESDLPLAAWWLLATALYVKAADEENKWWLAASAGAMALAALTAYQAIVLVPVLFLYNRRYWWATLTPALVIGVFQLWERSATGAMPAQVLAGFFTQYGLQSAVNKMRNAGALTVHLGWLIFPLATLPRHWRLAIPFSLAGVLIDAHPLFWIPFGLGASLLIHFLRLARTNWLARWVVVFFAAALVIFFAGSNRYLLPLALPVAILFSSSRFAKPAIVCQCVLSAALAFTNYQHWEGYRSFAAAAAPETLEQRLWINGEWGLRHYFESNGGLSILRGQAVQPGEFVVSSALADSVAFTTGGGRPALVRQQEIRTTLPLCLICLGGRSAYSSAAAGLRAFDIRSSPVDILTQQSVIAQRPERSYLKMGDLEAGTQIASGIYQLEGNQWRWMADRGTVLLARRAGPVIAKIYIPDQAPGRVVTLAVNGELVLEQTVPGPGSYELRSKPVPDGEGDLSVTLSIDKPFQAPGDQRRLGMVLSEIGIP